MAWWSGVGSQDSPLVALLQSATDRTVISVGRNEPADVEWWSDTLQIAEHFDKLSQRVARRRGYRAPAVTRYWRRLQRQSATRRLWWSGENVRPPVGFDMTFSSDVDTYLGNNVYFPYWWLLPGMLDVSTPNRDAYMRPRHVVAMPTRFCCAFFGKIDSQRERLIRALGQIGPVDVYGKSVGRPVSNKQSVAKDYAFVLCPENDLYPGYVTEKPFEAWQSGSIPLWWGSDTAGYLNEQALLNLADCDDLSHFLERVRSMWSQPEAWLAAANHPLLSRPPDRPSLVAGIRRAIG